MPPSTSRSKKTKSSRIPDEIPVELAPICGDVLMDYRYSKIKGLSTEQQKKVADKKAVLLEYEGRLTPSGKLPEGQDAFAEEHKKCRKTIFNWRTRGYSDVLLAGCHVDGTPFDEEQVFHRRKKRDRYLNERFVWEALKIQAETPNVGSAEFTRILRRNLKEIGHPVPGYHAVYKIVLVIRKSAVFIRCINKKEYMDLFDIRLRYDRSHERGICSMDEATTAFMLDGDSGSQNMVRFAIGIDHPTRFAWLVCKRGAFDVGDVFKLERTVLLPGTGRCSGIVYYPKVFRSDAAGVFASEQNQKACAEAGVSKVEVISHKSYLNGLAERLIGSLKNKLKKYQVVVREETRGKLNVIYLRYTEDELKRVFDEVLTEYLFDDIHSVIQTTPYLKFLEVYGKRTISKDRVDQINSAFRLRKTATVRNTGIQVAGEFWWLKEMVPYIGKKIEVRITPEGDTFEAYTIDGRQKIGTLEVLPQDSKTRDWIRKNLNSDRHNSVNEAIRAARKSGAHEKPEWTRDAIKRGRAVEKDSCPSRSDFVSRKTPQQTGKALKKRVRTFVQAQRPEPSNDVPLAYTPHCCENSEITEDTW